MKKYHKILSLREVEKLKVGDYFQLNNENLLDKDFVGKIFKIVDEDDEKTSYETCQDCAFLKRQICTGVPCEDIVFKEVDYYEILFSGKKGD